MSNHEKNTSVIAEPQPDATKELAVSLGLSVYQPIEAQEPVSNCPDSEMIAAYFDHRLDSHQRQQFLADLHRCPQSYQQWLELADTLYDHQRVGAEAQKQASKSFLQQLQTFLNQARLSLSGVLSGAIATAFLLLMVVNVIHPSFEQLPLNQQLVKIWHKNEVLDLAYIDIDELRPQGSLKSAFQVMPFPEKIAFAKGFKSALLKMSAVSSGPKATQQQAFLARLPDRLQPCDNPLCNKENYLNQSLGTWSAFVLQECQRPVELSPTYWQQQSSVINNFMKEYQILDELARKQGKTKPSQYNSLLERVQQIQSRLTRQTDTKAVCEQMKQLALYAIQGI